MTQFYSYLWLREDGTPYYAGKGSGRRAYHSDGHNVHRPKNRSRILVFPMINEAEAFESEIALIELFGRLDNGTGCLRNITDGGDGISGFRHSEEFAKRQAAIRTGRKHSDATKQKMRESQLGKHHSDVTKQKLREIKTGKPSGRVGYRHSDATREKIRQARLTDNGRRARDAFGRFS